MNERPDRTPAPARNTPEGRKGPPPPFFGILSTVTAFGLGMGVASYLRDIALLVVLLALTATVIALARITRRSSPRPLWMDGIYWTSWLILAGLVILIARSILT
ncbi:MAG: hypothetical protein IE925_00455 [Rhodobacterales bacterium]|nr:hypothetical protein [Rhodobacterales bacterium]